MRIGILLAVRNEAAILPACLESLEPFRAAGDLVVVCDDSSTDESAAIAAAWGAPVVASEGVGRGLAYRRAWEALPADADIVLITQADLRMPPDAREAILRTLADHSRAPGGWFRQRIEPSTPLLRLVAWGDGLRARWLGLVYGDQALFARRPALDAIGGLPAQSHCEDAELALRLRRLGPLVDCGATITLSDRHWRRGVVRATLRNWVTIAAYLARRLVRPRTPRAAPTQSADASDPTS